MRPGKAAAGGAAGCRGVRRAQTLRACTACGCEQGIACDREPLRSRLQRGPRTEPRRTSLAWLSRRQSVHHLSVASAHPWTWPGGLAGARQVPRGSKQGRVRRRFGYRRAAGVSGLYSARELNSKRSRNLLISLWINLRNGFCIRRAHRILDSGSPTIRGDSQSHEPEERTFVFTAP